MPDKINLPVSTFTDESDGEVTEAGHEDTRTCDTGFINTDFPSGVGGSDLPEAQTGDKQGVRPVNQNQLSGKTSRLRLGYILTHSTCQSRHVPLLQSAQT